MGEVSSTNWGIWEAWVVMLIMTDGMMGCLMESELTMGNCFKNYLNFFVDSGEHISIA